MRITLNFSTPQLLLYCLGIAGLVWMPAYSLTHPIRRFGDDPYGRYIFFGGVLLLAVLAVWRVGAALLEDRHA